MAKRLTLAEAPDFITPKQLVELGIYVSTSAVYSARYMGLCPKSISIGQKLLFPKKDLLEFLAAREFSSTKASAPEAPENKNTVSERAREEAATKSSEEKWNTITLSSCGEKDFEFLDKIFEYLNKNSDEVKVTISLSSLCITVRLCKALDETIKKPGLGNLTKEHRETLIKSTVDLLRLFMAQKKCVSFLKETFDFSPEFYRLFNL